MLDLATNLLGGIGLFLLGMHMMTHGLKEAAGQALRTILGKWTRTPLRGMLAGFGMTALVQSSSAVTVAVIGFVNAGLLTLADSIGIIFGSNVGTTLTGWIVMAVGLDINIKGLALPLIGAGMLLRLTGPTSRRAPLGEALAGFGLFFLGIGALQSGFHGLEQGVDLSAFQVHGIAGLFLFTGIGFLLTLTMQSSSAAMALVITAAAQGVLELDQAAAAVVGTNIGTTSTAALAVIGATVNARKVAVAHIFFNLVTGFTALAAMPLLLDGILFLETAISGSPGGPALTLALFHTTFNIFGVILLWPWIDRMVLTIERIVGTRTSLPSKPKYLDRTLLQTPPLALDALAGELQEMGTLARNMAAELLPPEKNSCRMLEQDKQVLDGLILAGREFCLDLQKTVLSSASSAKFPLALRILQYYTAISELALECAELTRRLPHYGDEKTVARVLEFGKYSRTLLDVAARPRSPEFDRLPGMIDNLEQEYQALKERLLTAGSTGDLSIDHMVLELELYSRIRRMVERDGKAALWLEHFKGP
ncbi:MAG TPA: Na/Pi symporter [Desulfomicrobiaceae bacterium]|nr:Na/Pi symporter [Desulfomicrobiaceae bacterium]